MSNFAEFDDETSVTDLEIGPDGRVYIFGASRQVLEILSKLQAKYDSLCPRVEIANAPALSHHATIHSTIS